MLFIAIACAAHAAVGIALGFHLRVAMLPLAVGASLVAMALICLATERSLLWPLLSSALALQLGYGAGSFAASVQAAKGSAGDKVSSEPSPPGSLVLNWLWARL